jgi:hypothetical protein|tara:strand:- start:214 stop:411 length:198 start_codon:yes stop_codon:yes gene_type:complete
MSKDRNITYGPKKHKDILIKRIKKVFSKGPTHEGEDKAVYDTKESGSNSYHANNLKLIKDLKKDA